MDLSQTQLQTIQILNPWWDDRQIDVGVPRLAYRDRIIESLSEKRVTFVLGSRRVGKTYLFYQTIAHLIEEHAVPAQSILFLSLDNPTLHDLDLFSYIASQRYAYIFLDEVQYRDNWQEIVKAIYDIPGGGPAIICSGSSSALIHDKKSLLTGRHHTIPVYPLSFAEFQHFSQEKQFSSDIEAYLEYGGYPEFVLERHPTYLIELLRDIVEKDIIEQYSIRRKELLFDMVTLVAKQIGFRTSWNKLGNVLGVTDDTVKTYLEYLTDAYLIESIPKYAPSLNERLYSPRKYYFWDTGMRNTLIGFQDWGSLAENVVYVTLRKRYPFGDIFYLSDAAHTEADFCLIEDGRATIIEVKYESYTERIIPKLSRPFFADLHGVPVDRRIVVTNGLNTTVEEEGASVEMISLEQFV